MTQIQECRKMYAEQHSADNSVADLANRIAELSPGLAILSTTSRNGCPILSLFAFEKVVEALAAGESPEKMDITVACGELQVKCTAQGGIQGENPTLVFTSEPTPCNTVYPDTFPYVPVLQGETS